MWEKFVVELVLNITELESWPQLKILYLNSSTESQIFSDRSYRRWASDWLSGRESVFEGHVWPPVYLREDRKLHRWYFHNLPVQINTVEDGWHTLKAGSDEDDSLPELQLMMMMISMRGEAVNVHNADANSIRSPDTTSNGLCVGSI